VSFKLLPAAVLVVGVRAFNHESKAAETIPWGTRARRGVSWAAYHTDPDGTVNSGLPVR